MRAEANPPGEILEIAIAPMKGIRCATMTISKSTTTMAIQTPAERLKIGQALAIQFQPLPIGTPLACALKLPGRMIVGSVPLDVARHTPIDVLIVHTT